MNKTYLVISDVTNCPNITIGKDIAFIIGKQQYWISFTFVILLMFLFGIMIGLGYRIIIKKLKEKHLGGKLK